MARLTLGAALYIYSVEIIAAAKLSRRARADVIHGEMLNKQFSPVTYIGGAYIAAIISALAREIRVVRAESCEEKIAFAQFTGVAVVVVSTSEREDECTLRCSDVQD